MFDFYEKIKLTFEEIVLSQNLFLLKHITEYNSELDPKDSYFDRNRYRNCKKYVILTSINNPTDQVKYINDALVDWCLIVVGDTKTPKNFSYKHLVYLDFDYQVEYLSKKYSILSKIPTKSYVRKMIGYLYAIDLGAEFIYETDDDNAPDDGLFNFRFKKFLGLEFNCKLDSDDNLFINPYSYFGQPTVWPRGYPLERISNEYKKHLYECNEYSVYMNSEKVPLIQQGLVNGDPDVDAIYRLTRKFYKKRLNIKFDENAPALILNQNQYAPINSQNTFFHYDAFWSLIFPLNVTFREVDILRGYMSIRLLQEINGRVAFIRPNAFQIRNSHSYHKDYLEEQRLYISIESFVKDLNEWRCDAKKLEICLIECIKYMVNKGHLTKIEIEFYQKWINDLNKLGYKWPKIERKFLNLEKNDSLRIFYKSIEQTQSSISNDNQPSLRILKTKNSICPLTSDQNYKIDNIVLITYIDSIDEFRTFRHTLNLKFPYTVICTKNKDIVSHDFLNENYGYTILLINTSESFSNCIDTSLKIGFKQQSFIFFKNFRNIAPTFMKTIEFNSIGSKENNDFEENFLFFRKNIGNGLRMGKIEKNNNDLQILCQFLNETFEQSNLDKAIKNLKWHSNDLVSESCENVPIRTIWIPDLHDGPRVDISTTLVFLGQNPILAGHKKDNSPYREALKWSKISNQLSSYIIKYTGLSGKFSDFDAKDNFEFYKSSSDFQSVNLIICSFPASLCDCFIPLNKTIIFNPAHRYNLGKCSQEKWSKLNENYNKLYKRNKLITSGMSQYDLEYHKYFTGYESYRLFAYGGYYAGDVKYDPFKGEILIGPSNGFGKGGSELIQSLTSFPSEFKFKKLREVYPSYSLSQLANHRAIILFPYAAMSYSMVDFYISNIPLFIPSIEIVNKYKMVFDKNINSSLYCGNKLRDIESSKYSLYHGHSPSDDSDESYKYWMSYADYYVWPHVTVFDSIEDLIEKLRNLNLKGISDKMKKYNQIKEAVLLDNWCNILKRVDQIQPIPESFEKSLEYFDIKKLF
ncbi:unnamed protein product [Brachionus calyciflorus]|uniref:Uncharacterized protein n=1 Tax=Brachionus calyciflorus TaxID=104777 RepID=A0A814A9M2_9BILA|nr:unnamed protein product [Brachionus calyciflorus]